MRNHFSRLFIVIDLFLREHIEQCLEYYNEEYGIGH